MSTNLPPQPTCPDFPYCLPKIIKISPCLLKLQLDKIGAFFETQWTRVTIAPKIFSTLSTLYLCQILSGSVAVCRSYSRVIAFFGHYRHYRYNKRLKPVYRISTCKQEAQLSLTNRAMLFCKVVEVLQDILSANVDKKFTRQVPNYYSAFDTIILLRFYN